MQGFPHCASVLEIKEPYSINQAERHDPNYEPEPYALMDEGEQDYDPGLIHRPIRPDGETATGIQQVSTTGESVVTSTRGTCTPSFIPIRGLWKPSGPIALRYSKVFDWRYSNRHSSTCCESPISAAVE